MLKSMTGFGSSHIETENFSASVEVKSLNSKFFDCQIRLPKPYYDKDIEIRNLAVDILERGKVSIVAELELKGNTEPGQLYNRELFKAYYTSLKELADSVNACETDIFKIAIQQPDVITSYENNDITERFWPEFKSVIKNCLDECDRYRIDEGESLEPKINDSVILINNLRTAIKKLDPQRIERIRERINKNLSELIGQDKIDQNRLEQELIYFIEKLDINEELNRLESHLKYFREVMAGSEGSGKKLGFISQEIGREINTIGSKANNAEMQKLVVQMKDELEKIKEQLLNVL